MEIFRENTCLNHLIHAGELGKKVALYNWASTPLGDPADWSPSLLTSLGIILESHFPMHLYWGEENVQFYNDAFKDILGDRHPEALGAPAAATWAEKWEGLQEILARVKKGESVFYENYPVEIRINGKNVQRYFTINFSPVRDRDGRIVGVLDTVLDMTSEILNKNALSQNEEKFRTLLEAAPTPFLSIDSNWIINYINPSALNLINVEIEEIIGYTLWDVFPNLVDSAFEAPFREAMYKGKNVSATGFFNDFNRWYQVWAYPFNEGIALSFVDINESKRLEQKLNEAIIVRDDFLSISSHELNTPLTSLKIQSQLLRRDILNGNPKAFDEARIKKFSDQTEKQVLRLTRLIEDMLDVARIRSGKLTIKKENLELIQFVKDVVLRMDPHFKVAGLDYPEFKVIGCSELYGEWDSVRIEQVITNLINNAIRYGEGKPICLQVECKGEKVVISIHDHGQGIEKASLDRIFERFERASEKQQTKGLGLGLYIATQIVAAHDGRIWVESTVGKGSSFYVELPVSSRKSVESGMSIASL